PLPCLAAERRHGGNASRSHNPLLFDNDVSLLLVDFTDTLVQHDVVQPPFLHEPDRRQHAIAAGKGCRRLAGVLDNNRLGKRPKPRLHRSCAAWIDVVEMAGKKLATDQVAGGNEVAVKESAGLLEPARLVQAYIMG